MEKLINAVKKVVDKNADEIERKKKKIKEMVGAKLIVEKLGEPWKLGNQSKDHSKFQGFHEYIVLKMKEPTLSDGFFKNIEDKIADDLKKNPEEIEKIFDKESVFDAFYGGVFKHLFDSLYAKYPSNLVVVEKKKGDKNVYDFGLGFVKNMVDTHGSLNGLEIDDMNWEDLVKKIKISKEWEKKFKEFREDVKELYTHLKDKEIWIELGKDFLKEHKLI